MEGTFYCILLINKHNGQRGYVVDSPKGIEMASKFVGDCKTFPTYADAQDFMREKKLERGGITAYIRDNKDIMKEGEHGNVHSMKSVFLIGDGKENYLHFNTNPPQYYFRNGQVGAAAWCDLESTNKAIQNHQPYFPNETLTAEEIKSN